MKIKSQFIICIVVFSIMLVVIAGSVAITEQQIIQHNIQEEIANKIERGASSLNSVSIDYFLYQEDLQLSRWESSLSALSADVTNLKPTRQQQQTFANNIVGDLQKLNNLFDDVVAYLQNAPRNVSVRIDPAFQLRWSSMAVQSQALAFDASQLSRSLDEQAHQANNTNTLLIVSLVGTFGAFLAAIYLMIFRRTLKSVDHLQKGINTIGTGNLDYTIKIEGQNEITELSRAFNQMTSNLKTVTTCKTDLEQEILGRKQAEIALRESEQRWSTTLASIGDAVIATDLSGKIMFMNGVSEELTGWTLTEASLKPVGEIFNIVNEQTRLEVEDPVSKVLEKGMIVGLANHTILIRKNKTEVAIDDSGAPIKDKEGKITGVVLIFRDITERKKAEEELRKAEETARHRAEELELLQQKLEEKAAEVEEYATRMEELAEDRARKLQDAERLAAIGATAGMVGHDIRNPLQSIISDLYLAKSDLASLPESEEKQSITENLDEIGKSVEYVNKIVQDLQDFARPVRPVAKSTDLGEAIEDQLSRIRIPPNVKASSRIENNAKTVLADPDILKRILANLMMNAVQAMPDGGKLTIHAYRTSDGVAVDVKDTGVGIPEDVKCKLFTPLFTTKSKGQGFGLAVVKRLTESLNGTVDFESKTGKGTTFTIKLPSTKKDSQ